MRKPKRKIDPYTKEIHRVKPSPLREANQPIPSPSDYKSPESIRNLSTKIKEARAERRRVSHGEEDEVQKYYKRSGTKNLVTNGKRRRK